MLKSNTSVVSCQVKNEVAHADGCAALSCCSNRGSAESSFDESEGTGSKRPRIASGMDYYRPFLQYPVKFAFKKAFSLD